MISSADGQMLGGPGAGGGGLNTEDWHDWLDSADLPTVPPNMAVQVTCASNQLKFLPHSPFH